jgi:hypothetical protein
MSPRNAPDAAEVARPFWLPGNLGRAQGRAFCRQGV